jgi:hypothetical protein
VSIPDLMEAAIRLSENVLLYMGDWSGSGPLAFDKWQKKTPLQASSESVGFYLLQVPSSDWLAGVI